MPGTAGNKIKLQFTSFDVESGFDYVYIYDGTSVNAPLIGTYDSNNPPGTVYGTSSSGALTVRLTSDGVVQKNGFSATIGCVTAVPPQAQPDLVVRGASLAPPTVMAGGSLTSNCTVYNPSGAIANSSTVGYYLSADATLDASDQLLGNSQGFALPPGQSSSRYASFAVPVSTPPGNYHVLFAADYLDQVSESNEANNVMAASLTVVPPGVDLVIQQEQLYPSTTVAGNSLQANATIVNQGNITATSSVVGIYLSNNQLFDANDVLMTTLNGSALTANQSSYRSAYPVVPAGTAAGSYYVLFVADPQNAVAETNEANNLATQALNVTGPFSGTVVPLSGSATITTCSTTVYDNGGYKVVRQK